MVFDEYDEMKQENIPLALERMSGQRDTQLWQISTPTLPGHGINEIFQGTTQEHFIIKCPSCSRFIELLEENLVVTGDYQYDSDLKNSYLKCTKCSSKLTDPNDSQNQFEERKSELVNTGIWVPNNESDSRGFYINQLYSCAKAGQPAVLAKAKLRGLTNKAAEQEWHNSKLGDAHEVEGARISKEVIQQCQNKDGRLKSDLPITNRIHTMGVDVGKWLHIEIAAWDIKRFGSDINANSKPIIIWEGTRPMTTGMTELDNLMRQYQVLQCVVDMFPERASALAFARRFWGYVKLCTFARGMSSKSLAIDSTDDDFKINVDRTMWLDIALGRFHSKSIDLPIDLSGEYKSHVQKIARIYEEDSDGNPVSRWISNGTDHFAFSRVYNEIALPLAAAITRNTNAKVFL